MTQMVKSRRGPSGGAVGGYVYNPGGSTMSGGGRWLGGRGLPPSALVRVPAVTVDTTHRVAC